jgi:hypothetical protein
MNVKTLAWVMVLGLAAPAVAQTPADAPVSPEISSVPASIPIGSRVGEVQTSYDDGGRRDPFSSLVQPRRAAVSAAVSDGRPRRGLASLALADIAVRGIVRNGEQMLAIIEGPNRQSFVAHTSDQLLDADIESIDATGVVFAQLLDAGLPTNYIRKALRSAGEEVR